MRKYIRRNCRTVPKKENPASSKSLTPEWIAKSTATKARAKRILALAKSLTGRMNQFVVMKR